FDDYLEAYYEISWLESLEQRRLWRDDLFELYKELIFGGNATRAIPNMGFNLVNVEGFLYLEIEVVCVEFGCHFEVELECEQHEHRDVKPLKVDVVVSLEFALSTLMCCKGYGFFLQMGFTLILAILDGLDVGLLGDVIDDDDCDDDDDD
ncbi:hypothetical protein Tco_0884191, partial [Tanacetum coccineum]